MSSRAAALLLTIPISLFAAAAAAQPVGHVGLLGGQSSVDANGYENASGYKLFAGVSFSTYGSLDLAYANLGKFNRSGVSDTYFDLDGFELTAMGSYPLSQRVSLFARAGYYSWNLDSVLSGTKFGFDGTDFTLGAGMRFGISDDIRLHLEYQKYNDIEGADFDSIYAGFDFGF
jgi:opacity protein-like surface antigen